MSKLFAFAFGLSFIFSFLTMSTITNAAEDATPKLVSKTPMILKGVSASGVCGSTKSKPDSLQCLGAEDEDPIANDTVSKLKYFVIGGPQLCGVDERGPRCWNLKSTFKKPVQELLAKGDASRAQLERNRICVPHADSTIHCHHATTGVWIDSVEGSGKKDKFIYKIPPSEVFGPYANLRSFDTNTHSLCALDGETVKCDAFKEGNGKIPTLPTRKYSGPIAMTAAWNSVCVLSPGGLDCAKGNTPEEAVQYHFEGRWKNAVKLFRRGYESICGADKDNRPICIRLGDKTDEFTDATPDQLLKSEIEVVDFKAHEESACALVKERATQKKSLMCGAISTMSYVANSEDVVDFTVGDSGNCMVNKKGDVTCFYGSSRIESPLREDGSVAQTAGRCRWNNSGFQCASTAMDTDYSDIAKVISSTEVEHSSLPCILFDNRAGVRSVRCFGVSEELGRSAKNLSAADTSIIANYRTLCIYGGPGTNCWGEKIGGQDAPNLSNTKKLMFGTDFACALDEFGFLCWGQEMEARSLNVPQGLGDIDSVRSFGVGYNHVCAITRDNQIQCWGKNDHGQIDYPQLTNPTSIVVNGNINCASSDEGVTCWGDKNHNLLSGNRKPVENFGSLP